MEITRGYNSSENRIIISIKTKLFDKYLPNFIGLVKNSKEVPSGTEVSEGGDENEAVVSFPLPKDSMVKNGRDEGVKMIAMDASKITPIHNLINLFINVAVRKEFKTTEFIPLHGYPTQSLKEDISKAIQGKRNLCIVKTYDEYLSISEKNQFKFNQYVVEFGTDEYADVALMLYSEDIVRLRKEYEPKLVYSDWV